MIEAQDQIRAMPFVKWAGGKGQLLKQYDGFFPRKLMRDYYEPFVGSGAVFFYLRGKGLFERYYLSDVNEELVNCYKVVRDDVDGLIELLSAHKIAHERQGKTYYYSVRDWDRLPDWHEREPLERAARMIYLNKTCFNGLWRVNSKGQFNVPIGRYKNPDILNEQRLRDASEALQEVELFTGGFVTAAKRAQEGDFVYFDPPYVPLSDTANFTSYSADSFGDFEQRQLAWLFSELDRRGCRVMLSNSDTPLVHELYERDFRIETVAARRAISSNGSDRGPITEVVVLNYTSEDLESEE